MSAPDPFRVLMLSGASSVHTIRWANALAQRGIDLHLVSQHDPVDPLHTGVTLHRFPHAKGAGYVTNGPRLRGLVKELRPDVVNAHYATGYGTLARWVGKVPLALNVWGSDVYDFPVKSAAHLHLLRGNLRRADRIVSTSHVMAAQTLRICPGLADIAVVPFGVDTERFRPDEKPHDPASVTIGTVKTFAPKYGVDTLIEAFALLEGRSLLRLVGGGPDEDRLRALAEERGVADRTTFVPRVPHDRVPDELRKLDVYVALSRLDSESFGVAVIEASACGLPVLVSDAGGLPEVVVEGSTGFVVRRDDPAAAAARLAELIASPALRERMGQVGRRHVEEHYRWDRCVDRMIEVLRATAHEHRPAP